MIILDTNVISELMRPAPSRSVVKWIATRPAVSLFTTTITQAELLYGIALLPNGRRRSSLEDAAGIMFEEDFADRVLPFDTPSARAFAEIASQRRRAGEPIAQLDAQIAAIARSRNGALATRNVSDFEGCGIALHNPWLDK